MRNTPTFVTQWFQGTLGRIINVYAPIGDAFQTMPVSKRVMIGGSFALDFFLLDGGQRILPGSLDLFTPRDSYHIWRGSLVAIE